MPTQPAHPVDPGPYRFFATCPRNTEGLLLAELQGLGVGDVAETRGGVGFTGTLPLAYRACLWSRVASRVLLGLGSFPISGLDDVYEGVGRMAWEDHVAVDGTIAVEVTSTVRQGPLARLNTHFAEQRVKDAVVDRFRARKGTRPGVDLARPDIRIGVHLTPRGRSEASAEAASALAEAEISLDLSGGGLHRRGYRLEGGEAPLKENLAAAILLRAGWPAVAARGGPLVDPMCGSGTLLIEGALMAADVAPGLLRDYWGFLKWQGFDPAPWRDLVREAEARRAEGLPRLPALYGFDADKRALGTARANARRAGLAGRILLEARAVSQLVAPEGATARRDGAAERPGATAPAGGPTGLVVTNPPYGKRLGDVSDLIPLYETLGERLKESFAGWEAAVFTGNPDLGPHLGLRAHRVNTLYNGPIECKLLLFDIGADFVERSERGDRSHSPEAGAADSTAAPRPVADPSDDPGAVMFRNRLQKSARHRSRWARREGIHCYRVYDADLPDYAVAVDLYDGWAHVQEYAPPATVDPVKARRRLKQVMAVVPEVLGIPAAHAVLKVRRPQRGAEQYRKLQDEGRFLEVEEGGLRFLVNLTDYLDTGLFLDHRLTRRLIRDLAPGRRFLNLFAYTGTATVYAAAGGASSTTTVDLSPTYLEWARRNLELNGFTEPEHGFVRADCLEWLEGGSGAGHGGGFGPGPGRPAPVSRAASGASGDRLAAGRAPQPSGPTYDLIFLDPPTFSNSKSMDGTLDVQRDHAELIRAAMRRLTPEGILIFSTNFRRFKLDPGVAEEFQVADITRQTIPPDFARNPRIHSCFRITRGPGSAPRGPH
jgi:23S rRNA (guanine2445-N2)-methyltransferase / 23S rRNA (guanine2069-N7)-methyltransferase